MPNYVIFSDLDGTLLDHNTYSFNAAREALELVETKGIPLVLCTSKTRGEIEYYRNLLNNDHPFISENGGGIFILKDYFQIEFNYDRLVDGYKVIEIGTTREKLTACLKSIEDETGVKINGFSQMTSTEIAQLTGLEEDMAKLAMERDYSEPFIISDVNSATINNEIRLKGYEHTRGGRFHHILGGNDKGKAVGILTNIYKSNMSNIKTVGIGDSLNDLPMLKAVDIPILVQKPDGSYDKDINLPNLTFAEGIGPSGWNSSILKLFMNFD